MTRRAEQRQRTLVSAALRHARDARALASPGPSASPDQAWHLAGYAPECAVKACLVSGRFDKALGHEARADVLTLATALDPRASRLLAGVATSIEGWSPEVRYQASGGIPPDRAQAVAERASAIVTTLTARLWAEGALSEVPA